MAILTACRSGDYEHSTLKAEKYVSVCFKSGWEIREIYDYKNRPSRKSRFGGRWRFS